VANATCSGGQPHTGERFAPIHIELDLLVGSPNDLHAYKLVRMSRISWLEVPPEIRSSVEEHFGARVVSAIPQPGGYSPGCAVVCTLSDDRLVFVKACGIAINPMTVRLHRREGAVLSRLGPSPLLAQIRMIVDTTEWVALVIDGVAGRFPNPTDPFDVQVAVSLLNQVQGIDPSLVIFNGEHNPFANLGIAPWTRMCAEQKAFDAWELRHLDALTQLEHHAASSRIPRVVCHGDFRVDNILISQDRNATLVDWAHAGVGSPVADLVEFCIDVAIRIGINPATVFDQFASSVLSAGVDNAEEITAYLARWVGRVTLLASFPEPPGITALRTFQRAQEAIGKAWLSERLG
jgi:hypothetical protein